MQYDNRVRIGTHMGGYGKLPYKRTPDSACYLDTQKMLDLIDEQPSGFLDTLLPGSTQRINHSDCPAGEDTKKRLYLTVPDADPNIILCYCHNCSRGGRIELRSASGYRGMQARLSTEMDKVFPTTVPVATKHTVNPKVPFDDLPVPAIAFLASKRIDRRKYSEWPISFDFSMFGIEYTCPDYMVLIKGRSPVTRSAHGHHNYQIRPLTPMRGKSGPKYITYKATKDEMKTWMRKSSVGYVEPKKPTTLIITEDLLSACTLCERNFDYICVSNYGVAVSPKTLVSPNQTLFDTKHLTSIVVWFDNDNPQVIAQAMALGRLAKLAYPRAKVTVVESVVDPKNAHESVIAEEESKWK